MNANSVSECQMLCGTANHCSGIEYEWSSGTCELWTRAIAATFPAPGHVCLKKIQEVFGSIGIQFQGVLQVLELADDTVFKDSMKDALLSNLPASIPPGSLVLTISSGRRL